ncbi:MAG: hypothetical protein Q4G43_01180 [Mobilicoccus sp.]|nr:hypothetical protein [Mobilicoccus sp.]
MTDATAEERERRRRGMVMAERIREALEDTFEDEVRTGLREGRLDEELMPMARLHDYLTGVLDQHEPRVRLLFELIGDGSLTFDGELADVPATCFFLGETARYEHDLDSWVRVLGPDRPYPRQSGDPDVVELWSAGDLLWRADRARAVDAAAFLTLTLDEPVGLWRTRVRLTDLSVLAVDPWSGRDARRVAIAPGRVEAEQVEDGIAPPRDRALRPRPRIAGA